MVGQKVQNKFIQWILQPLADFMDRFSERTRDHIFTAAGLLIILQYFACNTNYLPSPRYLVTFSFGCLMFGFMILAVMPSKIAPVRFDRMLVVPWIIVTLFMLIAGITKSEDYLPDTMLMLAAFPIFYMVGVDFNRILRLSFRSLRASFVVFLLINFLFFPIVKQKYTGFFNNQNGVAFYLSTVFCCCLVDLLASKGNRRRFLLNLAFIGVSFSMIFYSNSRSGLLAVFMSFCLTFCLTIFTDRAAFFKTFLKYFLPVFLSVVVFIPATIYISQLPSMAFQALSQLEQAPQPAQSSVSDNPQPAQSSVSDNPQPAQSSVPDDPQKAPETTVSDVLQRVQDTNDIKLSTQNKTADSFFTGRLSIWKEYIKRLSFWGHSNLEHFYVEARGTNNSTAHMTILEFAYSYGVLAGLAYLAFNLLAGVKSIRYALRRPTDRYALAPAAVSIAFGAVSLLASVTSPFYYTLTFYYYLVQCPLMRRDTDADQ